MGKKAKTPAAPDYSALNDQQFARNKEAAYDVMGQNRYGQVGATGSSNEWVTDPTTGKVTNKTSFGPSEQPIYDQNAAYRLQMGQLGNTAADQFGQKYYGAGGGGGGGGGGSYGMIGSFGGGAPAGPSPVNSGIQSDLDYSKLTAMPGDTTAERQQVQDALYKRSTGYLDPQYQESQRALETQLSNKGLVPGTPAFNNAMRVLNDAKDKSYAGARNDAIIGGGQEQERLQNMILQLRNQGKSETDTLGAFHNAAQGQGAGQWLTQHGQDTAANAQITSAGIGASASREAAQLAHEDRARQQQWAELMGYHSLSSPESANFGIGQGNMGVYGTGDEVGAAQRTYQAQLDAANAKNAKGAGIGSMVGTLAGAGLGYMGGGFYGAGIGAGIGGKAGGAIGSDRRLKSNIVALGKTPGGHNFYEYDILGRRERGVMAQEMQERLPDAVSRGMAGYLMVDYSKVN